LKLFCDKVLDTGARRCNEPAVLFYRSETIGQVAARCAAHEVIPYKGELGRLLTLTAEDYVRECARLEALPEEGIMNKRDRAKIIEAEKDDVVTKGNVTLFWGGWPSQWYPSDFEVDGVVYNCAEQYMMAEKARFFGDETTRAKILRTKWPKAQKELGRKAGPWNKTWDEPKGSRAVVLRGTIAKFQQNPDLRAKLLATGDTLIGEASPYDPIWGIGFASSDPRAWDPRKWTGKNWLGEALMTTRALFQRRRL
jgi:ribA/ribD-fused uncharacterized protein